MAVFLPPMNSVRQKTTGVNSFAGYNHNPRIRPNEFFDMRNMSSALLPVMSVRKPRRRLRRLKRPGGLFAHDRLCWADGDAFYYGGAVKGKVTEGPKQFVRMGACCLVWPDKMAYNAQTDEWFSLEASYTSAGPVSYGLCRPGGEPYGEYAAGEDAPLNPKNGALWMDTGETPHTLRQYSETAAMWNAVPTVYTRIECAGIAGPFAEHDGVTLSGFENESLNGSFSIVKAVRDEARGADYIVVTALTGRAGTQNAPITVERRIPDMDYVCECNNRVWGCSSERHEIYASALGDPKNWNSFLGVSMDSYAMTVGTAGDFTGCCAHRGCPLFFKENTIHQVMGSQPGNFTLYTTECRGLARGSEKSLAHVNETLLYKSARDVCAFGADLPAGVSAALGAEAYQNAVGGALGERYYLSVQDGRGAWRLFVYDTALGVWCREDGAHALAFAELDGELYFLDADGWLWSVTGRGADAYGDGRDETEGPVAWMLETGPLGLDLPSSQYMSGIQLYAECDLGTAFTAEAQYDGEGAWRETCRVPAGQRRGVVLPMMPRRCRTMKLRLKGEGGFQLFSLTRRVETGSDVYRR